MEKEKDVTVNGLVSEPCVGYHTLVLLEALRVSYHNTQEEIENVKNLTRPMDYEKSRMLSNLQEYKKQLLAEFGFWSERVQEWVSNFPERDSKTGDIILEYYCDIMNGQSLRYIIAENYGIDTDDDANEGKIAKIKTQRFHARVRTITLNQIKKRKKN